MTLKEELEILRGEPIAVFDGEPLDIPCIETSDLEKLCKQPVVSVHMITYNHEPYIRQAIEGVMSQQTDFEFELVIGEDCSTDKTREICFEYQKKYPEKIRVLWAEQNVNRLGGNGRRTLVRCRGEFIAFCEGDDCWTDPHKLQKQVDAMRANPSVGLCFARAKLMTQATGTEKLWDRNDHIPHGLIKGADFFRWHVFGRALADAPGEDIEFLMTATTLVRKSAFDKVRADSEIFTWRLCLGDSTLWLGLATVSDVYYLPDVVSTYRVQPGGVCSRRAMAVCRDAQIVRLYWLNKIGIKPEHPMGFLYGRLFADRLRCVLDEHPERRVAEAKAIMARPEFRMTSGAYRRFVALNAKWWVPTRLLMKAVSVLSLLRRRLCSDMSK